MLCGKSAPIAMYTNRLSLYFRHFLITVRAFPYPYGLTVFARVNPRVSHARLTARLLSIAERLTPNIILTR